MTAAPAASRRRCSLPRWAWISIVAAVLAILLAIIAAIGWTVTTGLSLLNAEPPGVGTVIIAPEESKAALAVEAGTEGTVEQAAAAYLAAAPTTYWLTPELDPIGDVGARVLNLANEARDQDAALAVAI